MLGLLLAAALQLSPTKPTLPLFEGGPVTNLFQGNEEALTNASAHVAWATAIPLIGQQLWGRKGLWIAGLSWMGLTLVQETFFHAPPKPGPGYAAEVRTDLLTRLGPTMIILGIDRVSW